MAETTYQVDDHFAGKDPSVRVLYDSLLKMLCSFGPIIEEARKTSIHLVHVSALAGVETRKDFILLNIKADHKIASPRVVRLEQVSPHRFHNRVRLTSPFDLDAELEGWLREAYLISE